MYAYGQDGANVADTWLLYLTTDGSSPDLTGAVTDSSAVGTLADGLVRVQFTGTASAGQTVKAVVRTRRAGTPNVDSENTTIVSHLMVGAAPGASDRGDIFFGDQAREGQ